MFNAPAGSQSTLQLALQYHQAGNFRQAETLYRQILAAEPRHPDALYLLGVLAKQTGHGEAAVELYSQAIQARPEFPEALSNLGTSLMDRGRLDEAIACYRKAVALRPDLAAVHSNLGNALRGKMELDEAIESCRKALALAPNFPEANNNLGIALRDRGNLAEALIYCQRAVAARPAYPDAWCNLGIILREMGRLADALVSCRKAIELNPDCAEAHCNLANVLTDLGNPKEAIFFYRKAISLMPDYALAWNNLGDALKDADQLDEAIACYRKAVSLKPDFYEAHNNIGAALCDQGRVDEAIFSDRQMVAVHPHIAQAHSNLLFTLHYHPDSTARSLCEEHARWNQRHAQPLRKFILPHGNDRDPDRRLKIGYVSPDFRRHPVGRFMVPLLAHHDRQQMAVYCYASQRVRDEITEQLSGHADVWRSVLNLDDSQLADLIRRDKIDILVDLALHGANNRLPAFARKPAPVQVTYLAYCSTSGMEAMDYRITDPLLDPPGVNEACYSEQSIRLPETYWCYQPSSPMAEPNPLPAIAAGHVTFACLNNFCKVSQPALAAWFELLRAVPNSHLLLHARGGSHRQRIADLFAREGIDASRLQFAGVLPESRYLELYHGVDIALDPFPFTGGTTTCDALWMGVPVVSLAGDLAVSRGGVSILSNVGLPELIAQTTDEYVKIAVDLANDLPRLAGIRSTLRAKMKASPLMDVPRFSRNIEAAYRTMWKKWCAGA